MRSQNDSEFFELLTLVKPEALIRVLEKGISIEKLELIVDPDSKEGQEAIRYSSAVLTFLRLSRLGA